MHLAQRAACAGRAPQLPKCRHAVQAKAQPGSAASPRPRRRRPHPADPKAAAPSSAVNVTIESQTLNSGRLVASMAIAAPPEIVWGALTDYEALGKFIPGLEENRCLMRRPGGAVVRQV